MAGVGWVMGSNSVMCDVVAHFGPKSRNGAFYRHGDRRKARRICLTESNAGTDLQNISTTATRDGDVYRVNGSKMWITNARHGSTFLLLAKTDPGAQPAHRGMSAFVFEKGAPGMTVSRDIENWGTRASKLANCILTIFQFPPRI